MGGFDKLSAVLGVNWTKEELERLEQVRDRKKLRDVKKKVGRPTNIGAYTNDCTIGFNHMFGIIMDDKEMKMLFEQGLRPKKRKTFCAFCKRLKNKADRYYKSQKTFQLYCSLECQKKGDNHAVYSQCR